MIVWPARAAASFSSSGARARQGPHHVAQKSATTGAFASRISSSNSAVLEITTGRASGNKGVLHAAQRALSCNLPGGTRLAREHAAQTTFIPTTWALARASQGAAAR